MRYFIIHLKDENGNKVDYLTGEPKLEDLVGKYDTVVDYLNKRGFTQVGMDVLSQPKLPLESISQGQEKHCATCGELMTFKEGVGKNGKPYKAYFCAQKGHPPIWLK